jgi:MFS family permease
MKREDVKREESQVADDKPQASRFTFHASRSFFLVTLADLIARTAYQMGKTPLLPIFAASLGASNAFLGMIVSVSTFTGMVLKPLIGALSDRWGRRWWLLAGTAFFAIMPFLYRFVTTPEQLFAIRIVHGLATAIYGPVTLALVAEQTGSQRAEGLGWFGLARSGGYILGPALAGWLLLWMPPPQVFTVIGILGSLTFIPVLLLPADSKPRVRTQPSIMHQIRDGLNAGGHTPAIWLAGGLEATAFMALYAAKAFLPVYATGVGLSMGLIGLFFSVQEGVHVLGRPLAGRLADRRGYPPLIATGMVSMAVALPLLTVIRGPVALLALAALLGAGQALVFPSTIALIAVQVDPHHLGAGMGLLGTMQNAGKVVGPILAGLLLTRMSYGGMFQVMGGLLLVGALIVGVGGRRERIS